MVWSLILHPYDVGNLNRAKILVLQRALYLTVSGDLHRAPYLTLRGDLQPKI